MVVKHWEIWSNRYRAGNKDPVSGSRADGYNIADVMIAMSVKELLDCIMDSGSSLYITYMRDYLVDFKEYDGGNILLGDGRKCRVRGAWFYRETAVGKDQGYKGFTGGTRRANCAYTLDGQAVTRKTLKGKKQLEEYHIGWKIKTCNVGVAVIQQQNGLVRETNVTLLAKEDNTFEVEPHGNVDRVASSQEVQTQDLIYYHLARDREQHSTHEQFSYREDSNKAAFAVAEAEKVYAHESLTFNNIVAYEVISKWNDGLKDDMDARSNVYVLSNSYDMVFSCGCKAEIWAIKDLLSPGFTMGSCQECQMVCTRLNIASVDVDMLDKLDHELQTDVQVFVDSDYAMGRSITRYGFMIQGCAGSLKANLQHTMDLSMTEAGYMYNTLCFQVIYDVI
nr:zinc finger, CCHC-type [Tanacetum cinerariifolium]